jgi:hypothetical protein
VTREGEIMAKKRAKKATRRASKAKASRAKSRPRLLKEFQLDIFGSRKIVARRRAPTKAEQAASAEFRREADEYFASEEFRRFEAEESVAKSRHRDRIERRPALMRAAGFCPPADVLAFLLKQHRNPLRAGLRVPDHVAGDEADEMIEAAYLEGCRQGYIEGYVHRRQSDIKRSRAGNDGKRQSLVKVRDEIMSRDERDERMAADYATLCEIMKPTAACMELASRYGFESWQGVRKALKNRAARQAE